MKTGTRLSLLTVAALGAVLCLVSRTTWAEEKKPPAAKPAAPEKKPPQAAKDLFDGKTLGDWKSTPFGGEGKVYVKDGTIVMGKGDSMTGILYRGKPPQSNFELTLEGKRLAGDDFFCTTTFPVGKDHCSLVVGGWGGTVVGLSNVDHYDASENSTTTFYQFKDNTWYRVRIRVSDAKIEAWINDKQLVKQTRKDHTFGVRFECEPSRPLGVSTWNSSGALRNIRLRELTPEEIQAAADEVKEP